MRPNFSHLETAALTRYHLQRPKKTARLKELSGRGRISLPRTLKFTYTPGGRGRTIRFRTTLKDANDRILHIDISPSHIEFNFSFQGAKERRLKERVRIGIRHLIDSRGQRELKYGSHRIQTTATSALVANNNVEGMEHLAQIMRRLAMHINESRFVLSREGIPPFQRMYFNTSAGVFNRFVKRYSGGLKIR